METKKITSTQWLVGISITLLISFVGLLFFVVFGLYEGNVSIGQILINYTIISIASTITIVGVFRRQYSYILFLWEIKRQLQKDNTLTPKELVSGRLRLVKSTMFKLVLYVGIAVIYGLISKKLDIWESILTGIGLGVLSQIWEYPELYQKYQFQLMEPHLTEEQKTYLKQFQRKWFDCLFYLIMGLVFILVFLFR